MVTGKFEKSNKEDIIEQGDVVCTDENGLIKKIECEPDLFKVVGVNDLLIYEQLGIPQVHEIPPTTVKKLITGDGKASKESVDICLRSYLVDEQKDVVFATDDCSDAVAVGIAWLLKEEII